LCKRFEGFTNETCISDIFIKVAPFFALYFDYSNNFEKANNLRLKLLKQNSKFNNQLLSVENTDKLNVCNLESLMFEPIQRLPRYKLLFKDLLKKTETDHPDYEGIKAALDKCSDINNKIEGMMTNFD